MWCGGADILNRFNEICNLQICGLLSWNELYEVIVDIEVALNNCLLCYMENGAQFFTFTTSSLLFFNYNLQPKLETYHTESCVLR